MKTPQGMAGKALGSGPFVPPVQEPGVGLELIGLALSILWAVLVLGFVLLSDPDNRALGLFATVLLVVLPVVLIWMVILPLRAIRALRAEAAHLRATIEMMRSTYTQTQAQGSVAGQPKTNTAPRQADAVPVTFVSYRAAMQSGSEPRVFDPADQPTLALENPVEETYPLAVTDIIRALNFPDSAQDHEGFRALRAALADRVIAKLIRAAEDVLTLLSQDGIYMDDLPPQIPRAELWRRFAAGERGRTIGDLGAIHDPQAMGVTAARMKLDPVFRDAAHHFLRSFDRTFAMLEPHASDQDLATLSDTRSARAFMLLGRVSGTFD